MKLHIIHLLLIVTVTSAITQKNYLSDSEIIQEKDENRLNWSQMIIKTIKDPKIYQILLITNDEIPNYKDIKKIQDLQENKPILYYSGSYVRKEIQLLEKMNSLKNPRDTTLFFVMESPENANNTQWTKEMMKFIKKLSTVRIRPRCLILRYLDSSRISNYTNFLQMMWEDLFLDVTIIDVLQKKFTIHQLNPFVSHRPKLLSKNTPLFPKKIRNLNEYPIKIGIVNRPPYMQVKRNSTNHLDIFGPDAMVSKIFSEVLNFKLLFVRSNERGFGNNSCNIKKLSGLNMKLQRNEIQFISITSSITRNMCKSELYEYGIFGLDHYVAIAPIFKTNNVSFMIGRTFYWCIFLTAFITIISWIIQKKFKLDKKLWNWTVVIQILFGVCVVHEPKRLKERIIFGCFLIFYFYYSFNVFASLTDFHFQKEKEKEINSLRDLMESNLQFSSEASKLVMLPVIFDENDLIIWVKNGRLLTYEKCIEFLLDYRNITCIMRLTHAEWYAGMYKEKHFLKFVPEFVLSVGTGFILEPGSPYVEKFQTIHRLIMEFALLNKWKMRNILKMRNQEENTQMLKSDDNKILSLMIGIMITGYVTSILSFLVEVVIGER